MKTNGFTILSLSIVSILANLPAFADECRLATPLQVSVDLHKDAIVLKNAVFNEVPRFVEPDAYIPGRSSLNAAMYPVEINGNKGLYVGAGAWINGSLTGVGVSNVYDGSFEISSSESVINGERVFSFRETAHYDGAWEDGRPRHAKGDAVTESIVTVANGTITSFDLTIPVYTVWKKDGVGVIETAFTGQHQKLCLINAM